MVLAVLVFVVLAVLTHPDPAMFCGEYPSVRVAITGYQGSALDPDAQLYSACRRSAIRKTAVGAGLAGGVFIVGLGMILEGVLMARRLRAAEVGSAFGIPSPDGRLWWDGRQWRPYESVLPPPPPPPPPPSRGGDDGDDPGSG